LIRKVNAAGLIRAAVNNVDDLFASTLGAFDYIPVFILTIYCSILVPYMQTFLIFAAILVIGDFFFRCHFLALLAWI